MGPVWWFVVGGALVVSGALLAWRTVANTPPTPSGPVGGLTVALGVALAFWGVVAVIIGFVVRDG